LSVRSSSRSWLLARTHADLHSFAVLVGPVLSGRGASLAQFTGHPAYGLDELHGDLERFVFLLGGSDGEHLFGL
jgi:hypothetical protein